MASRALGDSALADRSFRFFWFGQTLSMVGDRLAGVALALYVSLELKDLTGLGLILGVQVATLAGFLLIGGVWADRFDRRRLIIVTNLVCFVLHLLTAFLIATGEAAIWNLVIIEAVFGLAEAIYRPAFSGLLPQTVEEDKIRSAWGFAGASESASLAFGPALATALYFGVGAEWAFVGDAFTFLLSAASLAFVIPRARGAGREKAERLLDSVRAGWREVRSRVWVWMTILAWSLLLMLSLAPWFVLGPTVARDIYGSGSVYGIHEVFFGVGMISGAIVAARVEFARPLRAGLIAMSPWPFQFILYGIGAPLPSVFGAALLAGAGVGVYSVLWESTLARLIPPEKLSRVSSWDWMGTTILMPIGYVMAGPLSSVIPARDLVIASGLIGGACILLAAAPQATRRLRSDEKPVDVQ